MISTWKLNKNCHISVCTPYKSLFRMHVCRMEIAEKKTHNLHSLRSLSFLYLFFFWRKNGAKEFGKKGNTRLLKDTRSGYHTECIVCDTSVQRNWNEVQVEWKLEFARIGMLLSICGLWRLCALSWLISILPKIHLNFSTTTTTIRNRIRCMI